METRNPFVIQCAVCKNILADSFTLKSYKNGYLIFKTVENTYESDSNDNNCTNNRKLTNKNSSSCYSECDEANNQTIPEVKSIDGPTALFMDCILRNLKCICKNNVGVHVIAASERWNGYAGMYFINRETVTSYGLGMREVIEEYTIDELGEEIQRIKMVIAKLYNKMK